jgi:orotate phosphoribosyltransferase
VDDVITAGTAIRESIELIRHAGANPVAVLLALDRQERGQGATSAAQEVTAEFGVNCVSIVTLADLIEFCAGPAGDALRISISEQTRLKEYRERYGIH